METGAREGALSIRAQEAIITLTSIHSAVTGAYSRPVTIMITPTGRCSDAKRIFLGTLGHRSKHDCL
jgi:hypothetical protein